MTIKNKLFSSSVMNVIFLFIIALIIWVGYNFVSSRNILISNLENGTMYLQMMLRGINEVIITEGTPASVKVAEKGMIGFNEIQFSVLSDNKDFNLGDEFTERIDTNWQNIKQGIKPFLKGDIDTEDDAIFVTYGKLITKSESLLKDVGSLTEKVRDNTYSKFKQTRNIISIIFIVILSGSFVIAYKIYRSITSPINEINTIAEGFSNGDMSILMNESRNDEFGKMASYFNKATNKLNEMISEQLEHVNTIASSLEKLSTSSQQISTAAQNQSSMTAQVATAMEELNTSFLDVSKNTADAADSAREAASLALKGGEVVAETTEGMRIIEESVKDSSTTIEALGRRSEQIDEIIKVINDIAGQTNLLALNAAIEAARAGEQGRGFAVVADEVRKLAERTTAATGEIGDMINGIQEDTGKSVETMQTGTKNVEAGVNLSRQAGESLQHIVESVQNVTNMVQQIAVAAEEQSATGGEITANIESVSDFSKQTYDAVQDSSESIQNLDALAQKLRQLSSVFKLRNMENNINSEQSNTILEEDFISTEVKV